MSMRRHVGANEVIVSHRGRFRLWFGAGCMALFGAGLKAAGVFDMADMPREWGIVYAVSVVGLTMILFAILFVPRCYRFGPAIQLHYLVWTRKIPWADVVSVSLVERDTSGARGTYAVAAILADVPLVESFAHVRRRSGAVWKICLPRDAATRVLNIWREQQRRV